MALEMKAACMKCDAPLEDMGAAHICSYECTFCSPCTTDMSRISPNCGGDFCRDQSGSSGNNRYGYKSNYCIWSKSIAMCGSARSAKAPATFNDS